MKIFRTVVDIPKSDFDINYKSNLMFIGSCFTENIGNKFSELCFNADINPFGIIYNPVSIYDNLNFLLQKREFVNNDLNFHNERWFSFFHHSKFSDSDKASCLKKINDRIFLSSGFLEKADFVFITFGTSWIYNLKTNGQTVANCHKIPAKEFDKKLLAIDDIVKRFSELIIKLQNLNPKLRIILTVSPVRHWRDGAIENQYSKSILLVAVNKLVAEFENVTYFPSYEIMMDDLRDYRFYSDDMLHPSQTAINYIWEKISDTYFSDETKYLISEIESLIKAKSHRPFNSNSESYLKFIGSHNQKIENLQNKYDFLNIDELKL